MPKLGTIGIYLTISSLHRLLVSDSQVQVMVQGSFLFFVDSKKHIKNSYQSCQLMNFNVPVVFMARYVMILKGACNIIMRGIGRGGP